MVEAGSIVMYENGNGNGHRARSQNLGYSVQHGMSGIPRVQISWGTGNHLRLSFLPKSGERKEAGKIVEVQVGLSGAEGAEARRIASASLPFFVALQSDRRRELSISSEAPHGGTPSDWWEKVLDYSRNISNLLLTGGLSSDIDSSDAYDTTKEIKSTAATRAIWDMLEIFYVDKGAESWFPERLVDWLASHGPSICQRDASLKRRLVEIKRSLSGRQFPEEEPKYWDGIASALAVGWLDFVISFLRLHGSYRHDQIDSRQTENGLVEAVAVLVSVMPRLRPSFPADAPGVVYSFKPEFAKEWERWRIQVAKLDRSGYWKECHNQITLNGLKKLLAILQGNVEVLVESTSHWMELLIAHYLHVRPFAIASEGILNLAESCKEFKGTQTSDELQELLFAILGENTEVVIAECVRLFEPWMMAHMIELLTAKSNYVENLLRKERDVQGGISLEEVYRLSYAQALASHPLTWQLAPAYLAACPGQGLGMLETILLKLPVAGDNRLASKALVVCQLYDLQAVGATICRKVGVHSWKHGQIGGGIVWLQRAHDNRLISALSDQLLASVSTGSNWGHAQTFEQIQGLVDLLGSEFQATGGLSFLHRYRNFKNAMQTLWEMKSQDSDKPKVTAAGRQAADCLLELFKVGVTPKRFWMSLLLDSVELLEWPEQVLLTAVETNVLLNCVQELKLAKLWGGVDDLDFSGAPAERVRLALATNLGRAFLQV